MGTRLSGNGDYDHPAIDDEPDDIDCGDSHDHENEDYDSGDYDPEFMDPGGRSALRAGKRCYPCPTCGAENRLTRADVDLHYQCDTCADKMERGVD